ncbi:lymphocyte antigen 6D-like [Actinia tenebrosa]|uniref:Lymphocyte antigen 6D-like n=1 Tax=Actinia tenebrosa TaxID=6105 RepID=A0A6P8H307_ACTTE|nr:lymphocyte antigen 6D-like [Actinia tenebrosa]
MKFAIAFLLVLAVAIPTAFSLKCRYCAGVGSLCTGPSDCVGGGDTCFTTTYKNTSKVVKGCLSASACNQSMSLCSKTPNYCVTECCNTDGCNGSAGFIQINVAMVSVMAFLASISYIFSHH